MNLQGCELEQSPWLVQECDWLRIYRRHSKVPQFYHIYFFIVCFLFFLQLLSLYSGLRYKCVFFVNVFVCLHCCNMCVFIISWSIKLSSRCDKVLHNNNAHSHGDHRGVWAGSGNVVSSVTSVVGLAWRAGPDVGAVVKVITFVCRKLSCFLLFSLFPATIYLFLPIIPIGHTDRPRLSSFPLFLSAGCCFLSLLPALSVHLFFSSPSFVLVIFSTFPPKWS